MRRIRPALTATALAAVVAVATAPAAAAGDWKSGASGVGVADGSLATWRGTPLEISATWVDNTRAASNAWQLDPNGQFGSWQKDLDIAVGAFDAGGSWAAAASGAYDANWRTSLETLKRKWGSRPGTLYIRLAHEMNGNWYPWKVNSSNSQQFITAWKRYRALQQQIFPKSKLVFCVNRESIGTGIDWRKTFPGAQYVDVLGVDYYNQWPYAATVEQFRSSLNQVDRYGAPKGLGAHLAFARSVGKPLAIGEWSGHADNGDGPGFIQGMNEFFKANGGTGAGQFLYEVQFNVDKDNRRWLLHGNTRMPKSAATYRDLF